MRILENLKRLLWALPVIFFVTIIDILITFSTAGVVLLELLSAGVNKYLSLGVAILIAIGVTVYIRLSHKIRDHIKNIGANINE